MSTIKVDTIATRTGSGNITASNTIAGNLTGNVTGNLTGNLTGNSTVGGTLGVTGLVTASAGVAIGGTGSANTLDDYESGSWNGRLSSTSSGSGGVLYTAEEPGYYVKVGKLVHFQIWMNESYSGGSATNSVYLIGLPFVCTYYNAVYHWIYSGFTNLPTGYYPILRNEVNTTSIVFQRSNGNTPGTLQQQHFGGGLNMMISGTYYTDA